MLRKLVELYFYGNIHISLGALVLALSSLILTGQNIDIFYLVFVFGATLSMYSLHRLIGLKKILPEEFDHRFHSISFNQKFIIAFMILGSIASIASLFFLSNNILIMILFSFPISLAYVLPIFANKKRLRDFHYVKIFLIAIVWSWVCWVVPSWSMGSNQIVWLLFFEQFLFFLAITLPFDIRDLQVDKEKNVHTLPGKIGLLKTKYLAIGLLTISLLIVSCLAFYRLVSLNFLLAIFINNLISALMIWQSNKAKNDLFYTGWLDGLIILKGILIIFAISVI